MRFGDRDREGKGQQYTAYLIETINNYVDSLRTSRDYRSQLLDKLAVQHVFVADK